MATGRTLQRWAQVHVGGYPLCLKLTSIGPLVWEFPTQEFQAICDNVVGGLPEAPNITPTVGNGILEDAAETNATLVGTSVPVSISLGIRGTVAAGDPSFNGKFYVTSYMGESSSGYVPVNWGFSGWDANGIVNYKQPWGRVLSPYGTKTAANSATGAGVDNGAATTYGGYFIYHIYSANGTLTLSVDDSADDSSYSALSGATSGSVNPGAGRLAGIVELGTTATVRRYLRWQLALGTATTVTFTTSFVRGRNPDY